MKFIEFGVENYEEANTRFLMENNNWSGLIIDSSLENVEHIKQKCSDVNNVKVSQADVYSQDFVIPNADVAFIDAGHSTELVAHDINRFLNVPIGVSAYGRNPTLGLGLRHRPGFDHSSSR